MTTSSTKLTVTKSLFAIGAVAAALFITAPAQAGPMGPAQIEFEAQQANGSLIVNVHSRRGHGRHGYRGHRGHHYGYRGHRGHRHGYRGHRGHRHGGYRRGGYRGHGGHRGHGGFSIRGPRGSFRFTW